MDRAIADSTLCQFCRSLDFSLLRPVYLSDPIHARSIHTRWGYQIFDDCFFCQFICGILRRSDMFVIDSTQILFRRVPFQAVFGNKNITKDDQYWRIRLQTQLGDQKTVKWSQESITVYASIDETDLQSPLGGRYVRERLDDTRNIKEWMRTCETLHAEECWLPFADKSAQEDFRVLDLCNECLVDASVDRTRYLALSYVWGRTNTFVLSKATYSKLTQKGALSVYWRELPRTIQDAISFCRSIDERYLWVDSLCIIQDDSNDKDGQINKMDVIYAAATLTIIATEGSDCNAGLVGVSSARLAQSWLSVNGMELITVYADIGEPIDESVWNSRAWTFQEWKLSPRKLLFTRSQVAYVCRKMRMTEGLALEGIAKKLQYDSEMSNLNTLNEPSTLKDASANSQGISNTSTNVTIVEPFASYCRDVANYLRRNISDPHDILKAFSGVMKMYEVSLGPFMYGIPKRRIGVALIWNYGFVGSPLPRRRPNIPSWSWAGWITTNKSKNLWIDPERESCIGSFFSLRRQFQIVSEVTLHCCTTLESIQIDNEGDSKVDKRVEADVMSRLSGIEASGVDFSHLLIFYTNFAKLRVSREPRSHDYYTIYPRREIYNVGEDKVEHPIVRASPTWRSKQTEYLDFIVVGTKGFSFQGEFTQTDFVLALIEWVEGVAYRVGAGVCVIPNDFWLDYSPEEKLILQA